MISYYYDANGNRTLMNNDGVITSYTYDKNNRLLTEGDITYTYDANGNTLTAGDKTYTYNARGQQIGYSDGTTTATYAYNPSGLRSAKTVGGSTKYFVYNGMQIVFEYEDSVSDGTTYYYGLNRTHSSDGDIFVYNAHGDTVQLVNNNAVAANYTYDAFGNLINTIGKSDNAFLYCSEYFDSETETYYLRARYYNPANGRFTQQDAWAFMDPADPLTLNLYTYCANNPVLYVDPSGNSVEDILAGIVLAFGDYMQDATSILFFAPLQSHYSSYFREDEADYYLGRIIGAALSQEFGKTLTGLGIAEMLLSIGGGGAITFGSGGTLTVAGVSVCVEGVAIGATSVVGGASVVTAASMGIGNEWKNYFEAVDESKNTSVDLPLKGKSADEAAEQLGYTKTNYKSHGQPVYKKGNRYITPDVDSHNGGAWKMADSVANLRSKSTRMGTYDINLNWIGD